MRLFRNEFLDKLTNQAPPHKQAKDLRIFGTGLTIPELSKISKISTGTIRRYESKWNSARIPAWYFTLLRFLSGDLSYFGEAWRDTQIHYHNKKLTSPYSKYKELTPMDMNTQSSWIYKRMKSENETVQTKLEQAEIEIHALKKDNEILAIQNNRLKAQLHEKQIVKEQIQSGKVIEFKR